MCVWSALSRETPPEVNHRSRSIRSVTYRHFEISLDYSVWRHRHRSSLEQLGQHPVRILEGLEGRRTSPIVPLMTVSNRRRYQCKSRVRIVDSFYYLKFISCFCNRFLINFTLHKLGFYPYFFRLSLIDC